MRLPTWTMLQVLWAFLCLLVVVVPGVFSVRDDPVRLSESFGGIDGVEFSDQTSVDAGQTIGSITIRAGKHVDGIVLKVTSPIATKFIHGGSGGEKNVLKLGVEEYITSMEVHWGKVDNRTLVFYLSFGTSAGNSVSGGSMTESKTTVEAPEGFQLGGFFGLESNAIENVGAIWTRISAEVLVTKPSAAAALAVLGLKSSGASESESFTAESSEGSASVAAAESVDTSAGSTDTAEFSDDALVESEDVSAGSAVQETTTKKKTARKVPATIFSAKSDEEPSRDGSDMASTDGSKEALDVMLLAADSASLSADGSDTTQDGTALSSKLETQEAAQSVEELSRDGFDITSTDGSKEAFDVMLLAADSASLSADGSDATQDGIALSSKLETQEAAQSVEELSQDGSDMASTEGSTEALDVMLTATDSASDSASASAAGPPAGTEAPAGPTMTVKDSVVLSDSYGASSGNDFSDQNLVNSGHTIESISIYAGKRLDGITLMTSAPKTLTFTHGGTGGERRELKLGKDEHINSMEVHWGKKDGRTRIFYVNFLTSAGNSLSGGSMTDDKSTVTAPEGFQLAGFYGKADDEIDSLGVVWAYIDLVTPAPTPAPAVVTPEDSLGTVVPGSLSEVTMKVNKKAVLLSDSFGGPHGSEFSDQLAITSGMTIASVTIRAVERVDGLTVQVSAPKEMTFTHGAPSKEQEHILTLESGEYITTMETHWGQRKGKTRIFYLSLGTSKGKTVSGGTQTDQKGSVTAPMGYQLAGFFGRDGDAIDHLGAVWSSIAAVNETVSPQ